MGSRESTEEEGLAWEVEGKEGEAVSAVEEEEVGRAAAGRGRREECCC